MAKDPAFLFYPNDWLGGTMSFSRSQKGAYMDLLMAQFNQGKLSLIDIQDVLSSDFEIMWERKLKQKFKVDENNLFYNERLYNEQVKRRSYTSSRRNNLSNKPELIPKDEIHTSTHMIVHMENENTNRNIIEKKKIEFINKVNEFSNFFDEDVRNVFIGYWCEMNKSKSKFRFEEQKFFDFKRRLGTFVRNNKSNSQKINYKQIAIDEANNIIGN